MLICDLEQSWFCDIIFIIVLINLKVTYMYLKNSTNFTAWIVKISKNTAMHCTFSIAYHVNCNFTWFSNVIHARLCTPEVQYHHDIKAENCHKCSTPLTYPNSWNLSWISGYWPCFYIACTHLAIKCHNRDCYHRLTGHSISKYWIIKPLKCTIRNKA